MDYTTKIFADPVNRWIFTHSPKDTYIVGGYIRDLLRGQMAEDKDFVLKGDVEQTAQKTAEMFGGKFMAFHNKQTFRVVLKEGNYIDFSALRNDIMRDLKSRDFTINAIAWSPGSGILSPDDYTQDIVNRVLRHISPQNFLDDPLRILRAYRLSAQLDLRIQSDTRSLLKKYSKRLMSVVPERITDELLKLMNSKNAFKYIALSAEDNVISRLLNVSNYDIEINLTLLKSYEKFLQKVCKLQNKNYINDYLNSEFSQGLKRRGFIRLYLLLRKHNKSELHPCATGSLADALHENMILRLSNRIIRSLRFMEKAESMCCGPLTDKRLYHIFRSAGDCVYDTAIIQSVIKSRRHFRIMTKAHEYVHKRKNILLSGLVIQKSLGIKPGRVIGEIKEKVFENHFRGNIRNRRDARDFIVRNFT